MDRGKQPENAAQGVEENEAAYSRVVLAKRQPSHFDADDTRHCHQKHIDGNPDIATFFKSSGCEQVVNGSPENHSACAYCQLRYLLQIQATAFSRCQRVEPRCIRCILSWVIQKISVDRGHPCPEPTRTEDQPKRAAFVATSRAEDS